METLVKKTVLITGGNRGLGRALVDHFAFHHDGGIQWQVVATARNVETLPRDICHAYPLDLSTAASIDALIPSLANYKFDVVIHNAGFNPKDKKTVPGYFESTFYVKNFSAQNVLESCLINALHPMEFTGKLMSNNLLTEDAIILGVSSWLGSITDKDFAGHYGYAGSKALMNMFLKGMALEFAKDDFQRCAVALNPGWMATDMGGSNAEYTPQQVAAAMHGMVIEPGYLRTQNGKFLNVMDRTEHAW